MKFKLNEMNKIIKIAAQFGKQPKFIRRCLMLILIILFRPAKTQQEKHYARLQKRLKQMKIINQKFDDMIVSGISFDLPPGAGACASTTRRV